MKNLSKCIGVVAVAMVFTAGRVRANGGPFVIQHPGGDPAAKGVLARLHPDLKPGREERLRVIKEDLTIEFVNDLSGRASATPLANVTAAYQIENPTDGEVTVDFGFPILRGIYISPFGMGIAPQVRATMDGKYVQTDLISNSAIYGLLRQRARDTVEKALAADAKLAGLVKAKERAALVEYAQRSLKWNERDAALLAEYATVDFGKPGLYPVDRGFGWVRDPELNKLTQANLGILAAIGEKKATQLLAHLAGLFDAKTTADYEALFAAWGGDVRERAVDLSTGTIRPRENRSAAPDPTIYARVDYLDPNNKQLSAAEKAACNAILQNLPVTFTFAPMNLLHYQVKFAPRATQVVAVAYSQFAYEDTVTPRSYQLAYVVHPASLWKEFGPINLTIKVPADIPARASAACTKSGSEKREMRLRHVSPVAPLAPNALPPESRQVEYAVYQTVVTDKTGELFVGLEADGWTKAMGVPAVAAQGATSAGKPLNVVK
jgi:hypothetical protein